MKTFDVQTIEISTPFEKAFDFVAEAENLPRWTSAFKSVTGGQALLETPNGSIEITLEVKASRQQGTIDWVMTFPDSSVATAYSRIVAASEGKSIYSFILMAPPVPLEQLEGALEAQSQILRHELAELNAILSK